MMTTMFPLRPPACHRLRRREGEEMPRLFSTVIFLLISARQLSIRTCSSADMLLFTLRTKWSNSMLTSRSNCPSISVLHVQLGRRQRRCKTLTQAVFASSTSTSPRRRFLQRQPIVMSFQDMFWRTSCPVKLVVASLLAYE